MINIKEEKLKAAIQIGLGAGSLYTEELEATLIHHIKALSIADVSGLACKCGNQTFTHRHSNWIECTACNKIQILQACR